MDENSIWFHILRFRETEKNECIEVIEEVGTGKKARKVYKITEVGKKLLEKHVESELDQRIGVVGSDKFIIYPLLNVLDKLAINKHVEKHITSLNEQLAYLEKWAKIKINDQTLKVEKISFEMMIQNVKFQILWHEALIEELDACVDQSKTIEKLIKHFDFANIDDNAYQSDVNLVLSK